MKAYYELYADVKDYINVIKLNHTDFSPAHFHKTAEIAVCVKGSFKICVSGKEYTLNEGNFSLVNGYEPHFYGKTENAEGYAVMISYSVMEKFIENSGGRLGVYLTPNDNGETAKIVSEAFKKWKDFNFYMKLGVAEYILGALKNYCGITNAPLDKTGALIPEILTYIDENSKTDLTLVSVAEHFSYTPQHFSVIFNKYVGASFRDYLNSVRLYKAEKLINEGYGVCSSALMEGFKSLNTFYRAKNKQEKLKSEILTIKG